MFSGLHQIKATSSCFGSAGLLGHKASHVHDVDILLSRYSIHTVQEGSKTVRSKQRIGIAWSGEEVMIVLAACAFGLMTGSSDSLHPWQSRDGGHREW